MVATATIIPVSAADVKDFVDVPANSWYYDSVDFVTERDYMNGTSATTFSPENNMTRAMFVTVMARVAGAETDNNAVTQFTDVPSGQWYTGAVQWGVEKGIVQGHGNGTFGTNDPITRQDTAVLAQRFLKWYSEATGLTPETGSKVDSFTDASSISDYAKDAVEYCRQIGLLTGYEDGSFKPLKTITRAEAATILERMTFLAEGVLTVTYTDENGKSVMMEVKESDTFTVDPNGGKITYDGKTYDAEFTITVGTASLTLPAPTRSGYTFKGWKVTEAADGTPAFTAQWTSAGGGGGGGSTQPTKYEITYDLSEGKWVDGFTPDSSVSSGLQITLPTVEDIERTGYTLTGWNVDGMKYNPGDPVTVNKAMVFTACWAKNVKITFDYNAPAGAESGEVPDNPEGIKGYEGQKIEGTFPIAPSEPITVDGETYYFVGWFDNEEGKGNPVTDYPDVFSGNVVTYYGYWSTSNTFIYFDLNGGPEDANQPNPYIFVYETGLNKNFPDVTTQHEGYEFKGWSKDPDSTDASYFTTDKIAEYYKGQNIFYAVWKKKEWTLKYEIELDAGKGKKSLNNIYSYPENQNGTYYNVTFSGDEILTDQSDDISLLAVAKGFCHQNNIIKIINAISPLSIGSETVIDKDKYIHDVTVEKVPVADVVDEEEIAKIFNESTDAGITPNNVTTILNILDNGVKDEADFKTLIAEKDSTISPDTAVEVVQTISQKLGEKINSGNFSNEIKESLDDKLGPGTADNLLGKLGISDDDLLGMAQSYLDKLKEIFPTSTTGINLLSEEETTTGGGIEVKVNPVDVLSELYGTSESNYKEVWEIIDTILKDAGLSSESKTKIKTNDTIRGIIEKCDPENFFDFDGTKGLYKLKDASEYETQLEDIVVLMNDARIELFGKSTDGKISADEVSKMINSYVDRMIGLVGEDSEYAGKLEKIKNRSQELAEVFVMENPTLLDLMDLTERGRYESFNADGDFTLDYDNAERIVNEFLNRVDLGINDPENNEFVNDVTKALEGPYTARISITVDK